MTKVLEEMIEIYQPDDVDWMGFYRVKGNPYTFHHIREKCNKGKNELNNGAILTKNAHRLLNILEKDYPEWLDLIIRFREITDEYAKVNELYTAAGIITTRDAQLIKRLLTNKSFGIGDELIDKIIKYHFIGTKDDDYLSFINKEFEGMLHGNVKSHKLIKSFIKQAEAAREGKR